MFGFDQNYRKEYIQVTPKTQVLVNEAMHREIELIRRDMRRRRRWRWLRRLWSILTLGIR